MKKKLVSILLCVALMASGCGGNNSAPAEEPAAAPEAAENAEPEAEAPETSEQTEEETAPAQSTEADGESETAKVNPEGEKYRIALSNSYMGNDWRQQMERIVEYVAEQEPYASRCELTIVNCDNTPEAQAASIDALVQEGYDAILVDPSSETALNQAMKRATDAGILVVIFDQPASEESAYEITIDAVKAYRVMAKWLAEAVGGTGNAVVDQGLPGAAVSEQEYNAAVEIFDQYEGINVVSDFISNYAEADGEASLASVIAANSDIDIVVTQGFMTSVTNAFNKAGIEKIPASCGGGYNGNLLTCLENDCDGIIHVYIPGISAIALNYAIRILDGETMEKDIVIDPAYVATRNDLDMGEFSDVVIDVAEDGVNCFSDQPSSLQWPCISSNFGLDIPMSVVLGE